MLDPNDPDDLRDLFAAHALGGYLAAHAGVGVSMPSPDLAAKRAYGYADAMLTVRRLRAIAPAPYPPAKTA